MARNSKTSKPVLLKPSPESGKTNFPRSSKIKELSLTINFPIPTKKRILFLTFQKKKSANKPSAKTLSETKENLLPVLVP
jgi:hypothetical protein